MAAPANSAENCASDDLILHLIAAINQAALARDLANICELPAEQRIALAQKNLRCALLVAAGINPDARPPFRVISGGRT